MQKNYGKEKFKEDNHNFHLKEKENKEKMILVAMKMEKDTKHNEVTQCTKEGVYRVSQLIKNRADESSIAGVIDINCMTRRELVKQINGCVNQEL